jgi:hypothetical protein
VRPSVLELQPVDAPEVDPIEAAGDGDENRRIDDEVESYSAVLVFMPFAVIRSIGVSLMSTSSTLAWL